MTAADAARKYIGYLEHKSNALLSVPDADVGMGGCTIFAYNIWRAMHWNLSGLPWCVTFVYAMCLEAYGAKRTRELLGFPCAGVRTLRRRLKHRGRLTPPSYRPKVGDIYLMDTHCGIVAELTEDGFAGIDGNTVDPTGRFPEEYGGAVAERKREYADKRIIGYGILD